MKLIGLVVACIANLALAQVQAPDGSFNITNPVQGGIFVQGKTLPIVYDLLDNPIALQLNVLLVPSGSSSSSNGGEVTIMQNADVSEDASSMHTVNNKSYWEHTINYSIPATLAAGSYNVVFQNVMSHTNTTVPITINAASASSSAAALLPSASASSILSAAGAASSVAVASTPPQPSAANQVAFTWLSMAVYLIMAAALVL
ncbi:hypothetical protein VKS41_007036 [Umbelopsis sp. WA50703]